eukprot:CAMPEP_0113521870 /NCGR_PEP_ID=MMETSP0014_2-20120614/44882_1 /TAXON_ID=2857 /ORGANISM="Nitzschia sp." /LENGTH=127 /DNA_ID=CAMNT_0000419881 /DNA_START=631 /DNA_END=1014 /DNA_ORIENTATION=+ /assembly_acc=CAM_ASM_000159
MIRAGRQFVHEELDRLNRKAKRKIDSLEFENRQLKIKTDKVDNTKHNTMRKFVLGQYRSADNNEVFAKDYLQLRLDIEERSRLHRLDTGAEKQLSGHEMSHRAAARAGLQLPDLNPELSKDIPKSSK